MKAIVNTAPGRLELRDVPTPEPGNGQVRVKVAACGICATDLQMIAGWQRTGFPSIPGHEWSGVVDSVGPDVSGDLVGAPCVAENVLSDGVEVGFERPGGYGQYLLTDAKNVHRLPKGFPLTTAALIEPLAVGVRGLTRLDPGRAASALVIGDGPIGLLSLMLMRREGAAPLHLVGGRTGRLALARELGAVTTVNYHDFHGDLASGITSSTGTKGYATIIEASGSSSAMSAAITLASNGGRILVIGDYDQGKADFAWNTVLHKELQIIGSNASAGAWKKAVEIATDPSFPLQRLITHRVPAVRFESGMVLMRGRQDGVVKVIMEWE
jgi:2-desacetyl-2-hydroxyethyl bacteriochlorophyllide A dehydrogenase